MYRPGMDGLPAASSEQSLPIQCCASIPASEHATQPECPAMETNLRPLSLGEILDRTAQLYRTNFILFTGIESAYAGAVLVINLASLWVLEGFKATWFAASMTWVRRL